MRFIRSCQKCPLSDQRRIWGEGPEAPKLAFLGEAPGVEEVHQGRPFVGPAGRFLNWGLFRANINRGGVYLFNVLGCKLPSNNFSSDIAIEAQVACRKGFEAELDELKQRGLKVLVALGANATHSLGITGAIGKVRGSVYERDGLLVMPTYHPAYFQHMRYKRGDTSVDHKLTWVADLRKAKLMAVEGYELPKEDFNLRPTLEEAGDFIEACIRSKHLTAADIEVAYPGIDTPLSLVVLGLADSASHAISIPFLSKGGEKYWSAEDEIKIRGYLNQLFKYSKLMFQNALYDVPKLREFGFEIDFDAVAHDTMLLHHAITPEMPHDLGFIVSLYGTTPYWKAEIAERIGALLEEEDDKVRTYNLRDSVVLHQVLPGEMSDLKETGTEVVYQEESLPLLGPVGKMIETGIKLDKLALRRYKNEVGTRLVNVDRELREIGGLPHEIIRVFGERKLTAPIFNLNSSDDLRLFLFGIPPSKLKRLAELKEYENAERKRPLKRDTQKYTDLLALQELSKIQPIIKLAGFKGRRTDTGQTSTNEQGLLSLQLFVQNRIATLKNLEEQKKLEVMLSWIAKFYEYRKVAKLYSTYTSYPTGRDGRVHSQFLIHGTATGRLASRSPNLQNIPKREIAARKVFIPGDGYIFLSADYTNLEVWILAYESQDELLLKQLRAGINIHDENTKVLFKLNPGDPLWEIGRRAAKIFQFGGIQYGGSDREIYEKVILDAPELNLTFADFCDAHQIWNRAHPGYARWKHRLQKEVLDTSSPSYRKASTATGRIRTLMGSEKDLLKEVLNTPIQGGAASVVNRAMIRLHKRLENFRSHLVLQIHDEFLVEVWNSEQGDVKSIVREEMERSLDWRGETVSFPTDQKTGKTWADCYIEEK